MNIELPNTFKNIRKAKGISATFVAKSMRISRQTLSNKETGKTEFTWKEGVTYCKLLGVRIEDILV